MNGSSASCFSSILDRLAPQKIELQKLSGQTNKYEPGKKKSFQVRLIFLSFSPNANKPKKQRCDRFGQTMQ
jgi:hypothetical protein